jgi:hypothetical protein
MSRGLFVFVIQIFICVAVTGVGVWALARPRHLQHFIHSNFALLPGVKATAQITPVLLRLLGAFAVWYGYLLFSGLCKELSSLGFGWSSADIRTVREAFIASGQFAATGMRFHQPPPRAWNRATLSPNRVACACTRVSRACWYAVCALSRAR